MATKIESFTSLPTPPASSGTLAVQAPLSTPALIIAAPAEIPRIEPVPSTPEAVKRTFRTIPNRFGTPPTEEEMDRMYARFRGRITHIHSPTADLHQVSFLARTVLMAPRGAGIVLMDRVALGDRLINSGTFKNVYHGVGLHNGEHYAIGVCDLIEATRKLNAENSQHTLEQTREILIREAHYAAELRNVPGVMQIPLTFEQNGKFYFVMKFYRGGELFDLFRDLRSGKISLPLENRIILCRKILQAIAGVHEHGVIHRDLKHENILLDENGDPILCDFGLSTFADDDGLLGINRLAGTPDYLTPELISGHPATLKSDVWTAGMVLYNLLTRERLPSQYCEPVYDIIVSNIPQNPSWRPPFRKPFPFQNREIQDLICSMLTVDPDRRITIDAALERIGAIEGEMMQGFVTSLISSVRGSVEHDSKEDGKEDEKASAPSSSHAVSQSASHSVSQSASLPPPSPKPQAAAKPARAISKSRLAFLAQPKSRFEPKSDSSVSSRSAPKYKTMPKPASTPRTLARYKPVAAQGTVKVPRVAFLLPKAKGGAPADKPVSV